MDAKAAILAELARAMAGQPASRPLADRLCNGVVRIMGARGAALTLSYTTQDRVTLCATDVRARRLEDLQEVLGEGPGATAFSSGQRVRAEIGTGAGAGDARWPQFDQAARAAFGALAVEAIPIHPARVVLGVLTCHHDVDGRLALAEASVQFLVDAVGGALLTSARAEDAAETGPWRSRSLVHQATGMVVAQLHLQPVDALAILRAHAFARDATLFEVADAVLRREIDFSAMDPTTATEPSDGTDES